MDVGIGVAPERDDAVAAVTVDDTDRGHLGVRREPVVPFRGAGERRSGLKNSITVLSDAGRH
ncbi:hypothetical protein M8C17_20325 [Micromonospora sp. RHAY321]|uniref:hypothetical protein n=1 Tax=Micromonospora sp. RHAY321 TaxID=2944807 RepID=UPI00207C3FE1|nr:hypothetical protein [Micromonospora sp. RHAY321]MCO1597501.1 hypothetical protein [Micromonospora sp. RHAY321]